MSKLMRISDASVERLNDLSNLTGEPKQKIIDHAILLYQHEQLLKKANQQYVALKKDPIAWQEIQQENDDWDAVLSDGIKDDKS